MTILMKFKRILSEKNMKKVLSKPRNLERNLMKFLKRITEFEKTFGEIFK